MLTDAQLLKYSRQIMLSQVDISGQEKLSQSHVLIIGLGGLGSPVALYLAAAGITELTLVDNDKVDTTNLHRQIIHQHSSIGQDKVESAKNRIYGLNSECKVNTINQKLKEKDLNSLMQKVTVVADCSDNFETRFLLNKVCYQNKTPLVSGAAIKWEGQLTTFMMDGHSPCYRCLYDESASTDQNCSHNGIVGPVVGIIGSMQALEVIKLITGAGSPAVGELTLFDGLEMSFHKIKYSNKANCPVCS
jgi:molybdopterin/thiamine biosynthesis adenylyltransferase